jgi:hypothetical protein
MKQYQAGVKSAFLDGAVGSSITIYNYTITNVPAGATTIGQFGTFGSSSEDRKTRRTPADRLKPNEVVTK